MNDLKILPLRNRQGSVVAYILTGEDTYEVLAEVRRIADCFGPNCNPYIVIDTLRECGMHVLPLRRGLHLQTDERVSPV